MSQAGALNGTGSGGGTADIQKINVQTGTSPVVTTNNTITFNGAVVAAGTNPVRTDGTAPATMALEVQTAQAIASTDATKIGLAAFNSADFTVDANGFVSTTSGVGIQTITGNSGGAESPSAGNFNILGTGSITVAGSAATETVQLTGLTNHNVLIGAGTATITNVSPSTAGFVLTSNGAASDPSFQSVSAAGAITTVTGNTGGAESPSAGNFNVVGTGSITVAGSAATETVQLTGLTNHNVLVGAGTATVTKVAPSATSGVPLISQGAAADPTFGTAVVAGGGTGDTSFTAYSVLCGGTTSTGNLQNVSGVGTSGQVLTSNGAAALPTWQAASGGGAITTINGDTGSITGSTVTIAAGVSSQNCGTTVSFTNTGTTSTFNVSAANYDTCIGLNCGNPAGSGGGNVMIGGSNIAVGGKVTGVENVLIGYHCGINLTSGNTNTFVGNSTATNITTGGPNIAIGSGAGNNWSSSETDNIALASTGKIGESSAIRIGTHGLQTTCYLAGVDTATYSAGSPTPALTYCDTSDGQMVANLAVASNTATSTFGSLAVGTARQNTANYAILVNVSIVVTAATGATIVLGIGSTNTPTTDTAVTTFTAAAAQTYHLCGFVPAKYYMLVNTTGTITVGSITTQTCAVG